MNLSAETFLANVIVPLALVCLGASIEFFVGRAWRTRRQRVSATAAYLGTLTLFVVLIGHNVGPLKSLLCCALLYQSMKWLLVSGETREATVIGTCGTSLLMKTDDGSTVASSLLADRRSFNRGDVVRVRILSSYLFGWRLRVKID